MKKVLKVSQNSRENTCARVGPKTGPKTLLRCFPVNFTKVFRTHLFIEQLLWQLLSVVKAKEKRNATHLTNRR